jgi:hypothetical protein
MKKLFLLSFFVSLFSMSAFCQATATYNEVITKQKKGVIDKYTLESGEIFSTGDTITLGNAFRNSTYEYIVQYAVIAAFPLTNVASNGKVIIKKMYIQAKTVIVRTTAPQGLVYGLSIVNFESAVANGEIKSKIFTSDQALAELKKWKDKFDLGLISEDLYQQKKAELSKIIR